MRRSVKVVLLGSALAACSPDMGILPRRDDPSLQEIAHELRTSIGTRRGSGGPEDRLLELDARLGGVGGVFVDAAGTRTISLLNGVAVDPTVAAIQRAEEEVDGERGRRVIKTVTRQARYRWSEILAMKRLARPLISRVRGVRFLDADEATGMLVIGVADEQSARALGELLNASAIPAAAVRIEHANVHPLGSIRDHFRPTGAGMQIRLRFDITNTNSGDNNWSTCTMGYNVTSAAGIRFALTAAHCSTYSSSTWLGAVGLAHYVSNPVEGTSANWIGYMHSLPQFTSCAAGYHHCMEADVMLIKYNSDVESPKRIIHTTSSGGNLVGGTLSRQSGMTWNTVNDYHVPELGDTLHKVGRTSGWTTGVVVYTCRDLKDHRPGWWIMCNDVVQAFSDYADSGSPVFWKSPLLPSTVRVPVGILHAGGVDAVLGLPVFYFSNRAQIALEFPGLSY